MDSETLYPAPLLPQRSHHLKNQLSRIAKGGQAFSPDFA